MSGMKNKYMLHRKRAIVIIALIISGSLSPIGMRLLDHFEIEAPLADIVLSVILLGITWAVYHLMSRCFYLQSFLTESNDGNE
jgi:hypothetical protein